MPRIARVVAPNMPHHVTQRGNRNQTVFFRDSDRQEYLRLILEFSKKSNVEIWAYCLMTNHVHFIAVPHDKLGLTHCFQEAHRRYTRMINFRKKWRGFLWQGRYASYPMDESHLYSAVRYVERNPVSAKMVNQAEQYQWSSAKAHVLGKQEPILSNFYLLDDMPDWKAYLRDTKNDKHDSIEKHMRTGRPLGSDTFITKLEGSLKRKLILRKPGRKKK
jgi:putative transposase